MIKKFLMFFLGLLGFVSCTSEDGNGGNGEEYGTPTIGYKILGKVLDSESNPIDSVKVRYFSNAGSNMANDSLFTNREGFFSFSDENIYGSNSKFVFEKEGYEKDSISVHYSSEDIKGGDGHWNLGTATKGIVVKLKKDENEDTNK